MTEPLKAAAAIILCDTPEPRVLLGLRNKSLRFMGRHHVFPGGRIDDDEGWAHVEGAENEEHAITLHAVAREMFEETGLLPVRGAKPDAATCRQAREALLDGEASFDDFLVRHTLHIHADDFEYAGQWITPPMVPIRFDTQYLLYRVSEATGEELIEGELTALDWIDPAEARRRWRDGAMRIPPPVAYVLQQLARFPYPEVMPALLRTGDPSPGIPGKIEFRCGVQLIPLLSPTLPPATHTNCVVVGEEALYVIDPGPTSDEEKAILKYHLDHLVEMGATVAGVLLTHSHVDHVGAATFVRETYDVPIWAHEATAAQLEIEIDRHLVDNEVIEVPGDPPWRIRCIHTPGHDPGHLCFAEETTRTLIGGDMLANPGTIIVSPEYQGDMTQFIESLKRLLEIDASMLIPAHGFPVIRPKDLIQETIDHRLWREKKVIKALESGKTTVKDLLPIAYDDVPADTWPLAAHSLKAHLVRLGKPIIDE